MILTARRREKDICSFRFGNYKMPVRGIAVNAPILACIIKAEVDTGRAPAGGTLAGIFCGVDGAVEQTGYQFIVDAVGVSDAKVR